jgi:hypothetical protein
MFFDSFFTQFIWFRVAASFFVENMEMTGSRCFPLLWHSGHSAGPFEVGDYQMFKYGIALQAFVFKNRHTKSLGMHYPSEPAIGAIDNV